MKRRSVFIGLMVSLVFILIIAPLYAGAAGHSTHWGYEGDIGPAHWGDLSPEFKACKEGKSQSPVDIRNPVKAALKPIEFHYKTTPLKVINNGHTIKVDYERGSYIVVNGKRYDLLQFHFHTPSENTVNGKPYDMEAHLVHKSEDGQLAVVAVFMKKGKENSFIKTIWRHLPVHGGSEKIVSSIKINVADFLPKNKAYYAFDGSLTTPPCTEGVKWLVLKTPVEVSEAQVKKFALIFKMNARPTQPLYGRVIKVSE
jgi:carbonic anhydrase